jgi:hypothetical protein
MSGIEKVFAMKEFLVFLPMAVSVLAGFVVFVKAWDFLPVSGLIAFIGYLLLGVLSLGWFSSTPLSGPAVALTLQSVMLAVFFTWRIQRWCL